MPVFIHIKQASILFESDCTVWYIAFDRHMMGTKNEQQCTGYGLTGCNNFVLWNALECNDQGIRGHRESFD